MAVMALTRRQVVDMIPEFLSKRGIGYRLQGEAVAKELGISWTALLIFGGSFVDRDGDVVTRERYRWRSPYAIKSARASTWSEVVAAGLAEETPNGWRLTAQGAAAADEHPRRVVGYLATLALPAEPAHRAAADLDRMARRVPPTAERAARARRVWDVASGEPASHARTLSDAAQILWAFRDDCHVAAWQARGYEGPAFDVLSYVWSSPTDVSYTKLPAVGSMDALAKALEAKQDRADVERNVEVLVRRGDLARDGDSVRIAPQGQKARDAIEEETDRRYFAIWDLDDAQTGRLGDDLRAVIDALPKS